MCGRVVLPDAAMVVESYHIGGRRRLLESQVAGTAAMVFVLYMVLYLTGALVGMFYGFSIQESLFESTSAAAAVGLSVGVVGPGMPIALEVTYILQMWVGRLEFVSAFALLGYVYSSFRGRL